MLKSLFWRVNFFFKYRKSQWIKKRLTGDESKLTVESKNGIFVTDPADLEVGAKLRTKGEYGTEEIARLSQLIDNNSSILIVGAHIGALAIPLAKQCLQVVAIEANPNNFALLQTNIKLNNLTNITAHNIAASTKSETIQFQLNTVNSGGSKRVPVNNHYIYTYDNPKVIDVDAYSLDEYLDHDEFDLVLIDIEGSEYFAMEGMSNILSKQKISLLNSSHTTLLMLQGLLSDFLGNVPKHLTKVTIPSKKSTHPIDVGIITLSQMFDSGQGDDGIIFHN